MGNALEEWTTKGVPRDHLVLVTPLFGRAGSSLHSANDRNEVLRRSWRDISIGENVSSTTGDVRGDVFLDKSTGKTWWVSGLNTTQAKVQHVLENGYGGIALRDLNYDSGDDRLSILQTAVGAVRDFQQTKSKRLSRIRSVSFFQ